jgi:hypothetical protein
MRKILNFIVLLILIKGNKCGIKDMGQLKILYSFPSNYKYRKFSYYLNHEVFGEIIFCKTVWEDSIHYEVAEDKCKFDISNWQAKLLYKMAQNKYLKNDNILL